ncbi:hypothetical protein, partial [Alicyclobacillus fructus]|uniref:hypothetical protein n=1 Tax=Alicyclobacillus fructus TaxID=2816082 RepID=UPI001A8C1937
HGFFLGTWLGIEQLVRNYLANAQILLNTITSPDIHIKTRKNQWSEWGAGGRIGSEHTYGARCSG